MDGTDNLPYSSRSNYSYRSDGMGETNDTGIPTYRSDTARSRARAYAGLGTATFYASVTSTFNTMSLGLLAIPFTFAKSGAILASLALVSACGATALSLYLLLECARTVNILPCNWYVVAKHAWPKPIALFLVDLSIVVLTFGMCCSFLIAIGDLMPAIMYTLFDFNGSGFWVQRQTWMAIFGLLLCYPLSTLRTLNSLRFTNSLTFIVLVALLSIITLYATIPSLDPCEGKTVLQVCKGSVELFTPSLSALQLLPILIYTFCCQQNIFSIYNESITQRTEDMTQVVVAGSLTSLILKLGIGLVVYLTYGSIVGGNFFLSYPNTHLVGAARLCVVFKSAFSFPMQMHACRGALASLVNQIVTDDEWSPDDEAYVPSNKQVQLYTFIACIGTFFVSINVTDLGWFLAVMGASIAPFISYVLPGYYYWRLHPQTRVWDCTKKKIAAGLMIAGFIIVPTCMTLIILKSSDSSQPAQVYK